MGRMDGRAAPPPAGAEEELPAGGAISRKIIYTADLVLVVEDYPQAEQNLLTLVKSAKGYIARSDVHGSPGESRTGTWTIRVPVEGFGSFKQAAEKLGELLKSSSDSEDVSEEFFDLEARQKNKRVEEERLLKHLDSSTGKLEEILHVEREISRVRGEIERIQGRLQKLGNLTALTTITVTIHERKGYVPETAPTFGAQISRTFGGSTENLVDLGKTLTLIAVALAPWLPILALFGILCWLLLRPFVNLRRTQPQGVPAQPLSPS